MNVDPGNSDRATARPVFARRKSGAIIVALLVLLSRQLLGAEDPTGFRIVTERDGDTTTLIMKSDYAREFTVTFEANLENVTPSRPVPFTVDAAGRGSFVLVRLTQTDKRLAWRYTSRYYWQLGSRRSSRSNDADYAMPFKPGRYVVMQEPGGSYSHFAGSGSENAVDWAVPEGTVVCAARGGRVVAMRQDSTFSGPDRSLRPLANYVVIKHADGTFADYVHLKTGGALVEMGDEVTVGQPIGLSGQTGFASAPHLHFSVFQAIDGKKKLTLPFRLRTDRGVFTEFVRGRAY
ncbi:MAG TPA: M23 family metallopeptidase [Chthoniobacterales bacterium]|nr:M23 family metallopeptidase [Chthoniobacterales bacterium]